MKENSADLGSISALELKGFLDLIRSSADHSRTAAVQQVIHDLLGHTDIHVRELIDDALVSTPDAATVEALLQMRSKNAEIQKLVTSFQRELVIRLSALFTKGETAEKSIEYSDQDIDTFVRGTMDSSARTVLVKQLRDDSALRKRCIRWREGLSELDVSISAEAAEAFNKGTSQLDEGNHLFPGHQYVGQRANENHFVQGRDYHYATARASFEQLILLGELEDLAIANLAIVDANVNNAPIAARFYPASGYDHGDALVREVRGGKSPMEAVFGQRPVPSNKKGDVPPTWREGVPLRMKPDDRPIEELLSFDFSHPNLARQLIRRLNEFIPQKRGMLSSFDSLKPLSHEKELIELMEKQTELVDGLARFIEEPLPGGNDHQLSELNDSRQVAYRLLAMRFIQTDDTELFHRIKNLFNKGLESFRARGGGDWETNWFHEGPEIIIHYADENDKLWSIIAEVIEEASKTGMQDYFVKSLHLSTFTGSMARLDKRFSSDHSARKLVVDKLVQCADEKTAAYGVEVLEAFPDTERVPVCLRCLDGTNTGRSTAISHLQGIDRARLLMIDPEIGETLSALVEREVSRRAEKGSEKADTSFVGKVKSLGAKDVGQKPQGKLLSRDNLVEVCFLIHSVDQAKGENAISKVLDNFIETGKCVDTEKLIILARFCRENAMTATRSKFVTLYPTNIHSDCNACHSRDYLALLREWNVTDRELASAFLSVETENQSRHSDYYMRDAYNQLMKSFTEEEEVTGYRGEEYKGINNGKDPQAWAELVERGADDGDEKFTELLLLEPYRHLLTPERVQNMVDIYVKQTLAEKGSGLQHSDPKNIKLSNALTACAYLPDAGKHVIASIEQAIRAYDPPEELWKNYQYKRLQYFVWEIYNNARAVEEKQREGGMSSPVSSWLFLCRAFQPPRAVTQLVFEYCLNDKTRSSLDVTSSFDAPNLLEQMEAVRYVDTVYRAMNGKDRTEADEETPPISLQDLETYVVNLVIGRKLPLEAVIAGYCSSLGTVGWRKTGINGNLSRESDPELLQHMRYADLGLTAGGMNHRGPTLQALAARLSELYSRVQPRQKNLVFGAEEGQDPDLDITFFVSALLRIRKFKEAMEVYRDHPLENRQLYAKIARFGSMGACEAEEDGNLEAALEGFIALQEIVADVPGDMPLEDMSKDEFTADIDTHVQELKKRLLEQQAKDGAGSSERDAE